MRCSVQILPLISCAVPQGKEEYSDRPSSEALMVDSDKIRKKERKTYIIYNLEADISFNPLRLRKCICAPSALPASNGFLGEQ